MKKTFAFTTLIALAFLVACTKETGTVGEPASPHVSTAAVFGSRHQNNARYAGSDYSQSIPVDTANSMIGNYLTSVNYPSVDTAIRSLTFDADTLRAYLSNPNIATLKFMFAHKSSYTNDGNAGVYAGMRPDAMTMVIVGLSESDQYVLNSRNGVYEHVQGCPFNCPGTSSAIIQ